MSIPLSDLRAIVQALCGYQSIRQQVVTFLRALQIYHPNEVPRSSMDHDTLIQKASARDLSLLIADLCVAEDINKRVDNYIEALDHTEPAGVARKAADYIDTIKNVPAQELRTVMLGLCEDDDVKKRVAIHLRILRRSSHGGAASVAVDPATRIDSATEAELRAIGLGDEDIKKRLSESLQVLSIFDELEIARIPCNPS